MYARGFSESVLFFCSSRRRHTRYIGDWSSDVCSSDLWQKNAFLGLSTESALQRECPKDSFKQQSIVERLDQNCKRIDTLEQMLSLCVVATSHHNHRQIVPSEG